MSIATRKEPLPFRPSHTGYVVFFPGRPRMWFEPHRSAAAMEVLDALIRDFTAIHGRPPGPCGIAFQQGGQAAAQAA